MVLNSQPLLQFDLFCEQFSAAATEDTVKGGVYADTPIHLTVFTSNILFEKLTWITECSPQVSGKNR